MLIALARRGRGILVTSGYAVEEARRNLDLKAPAALPRFGQVLRHVQLVRDAPPGLVREVTAKHLLPMADAPILAAALQAGVSALITGDRTHFGHLMDRRIPGLPLQALSLAKALDRLLAESP